MKNFKNFEAAYASMQTTRNILLRFPTSKINEYFVNDWYAARNAAFSSIDTALKKLRAWLKKNFPHTVAVAYHSDQFSFPAFFEMLKKYPELAKDNEGALKDLLNSLKASDLTPAHLDKVPDISEFIK